ncbi:hypothetical protein QQ045_029348 [Rhodiola kirilowii]
MDPYNFDESFQLFQQSMNEMNDMSNSFVMDAVTIATMSVQEEEARPRRQRNRERQRGPRGQNLLDDYFIERPIFPEGDFRRRYRMSSNLFNQIKITLCNNDVYWHQRCDAAGVLGLLPEQKMTAAIQMLAYGSCADQCAEISRMAESTTLECFKKWCRQVVEHYGSRYLRSPNEADLARLLRRAERRGFPGMIGSIDCMHWEWKNCPTAWQGSYSGRKGRPTIILEAVASYDTWIWHSFIGVPGSQNDINVLHQSDVFDSYLEGITPKVTYKVNGSTYDNTYYLADGIYPRYSAFVKTIRNPESEAEKLFAKKQESYRKDVERCFGILQSRWAILRHVGMCHKKSVLKTIMLACIVMHNMIVEDEFVEEEFIEVEEEDPYNPRNAFTVYDRPSDQDGNRLRHDPIGRAHQSPTFGERLTNLHSAYLHTELQNDLVKHNWYIETGEQL